MDHVVRHVVEEQKGVLGDVTTQHLHVEEGIVLPQLLSQNHVHMVAVLVRLLNICKTIYTLMELIPYLFVPLK